MSNLSDRLRAAEFTEETVRTSELADIFSEEPVPLDVFVTDKKFLNNPPLSPVQYDAVKHTERIYYQELYPLMAKEFGSYWEPLRMVNFVTLQWGKGAGKDHTCRVIGLRIAYLLLCLKDPQEYFGLPQQDTIHMLNVASSAGQANQAYFMPITRVVKAGWFADKCDPKPGSGIISWAKHVEQISGHSDAESQEGLNLILGVADEIDAFRSKEELARYHGKAAREPTKSAEGILRMMRTSASTRFPETYKNVRISYPRYLGSTIQTLTAKARLDVETYPDTSRHYVSGPLPTWAVNPRVKGPEAFAEDYREDPDMARAMYECAPTRAIDTYFKNMDVFRSAVIAPRQPITISYYPLTTTSRVTDQTFTSWVPQFSYASDFFPIEGARYCLHADLAINGDKAGVAMSHVVSFEHGTEHTVLEDGEIIDVPTSKPLVKNDFVIAFEADIGATPKREIQIRWVRQLAFDLYKRGFNIVSLTYDGFQSRDSMQILQSHGIESERVSTDLNEDPWKTLRDLANDARFQWPYSQLALDELESLGRFNGKVDHPVGGSKDLADALACSVYGAVLQGGQEDPDQARAERGREEFGLGPSGLDDLHGFSELGWNPGDSMESPLFGGSSYESFML